MIVRCGRCQVELEVGGPGEFMCPQCGARNRVGGAPQGQDPFGVPDLGGLSGPGGPAGPTPGAAGMGGTPAPPPAPDPDIDWVVCPSCSWRFAVGDVEQVECPTCSASITLRDGKASLSED